MSGKKIIDGLDEAITQAAIKRRIYDWIKCDASIAVKLALGPKQVEKLAKKLME